MEMPAAASGGSAAAGAGAAAGEGVGSVTLVAVADGEEEVVALHVPSEEAEAVPEEVGVMVSPPVSVGHDDRVDVAEDVSVQKLCVAVAVHADCDAELVPVALRLAVVVVTAERVAVADAVAVAEEVGGRHANTAESAGNAALPGRGPHVAVGSGECV